MAPSLLATRRRPTAPAVWACAAAALVAGCGRPAVGTVTGVVRFRGRPLPDALVVFIPQAGPGAGGVTKADGSYDLTSREPGDGVTPGPCRVSVTPADPQRKPLPIPGRLHSPETSGLTADVKAGPNVIDLDVPEK